jgi:hypothetical protein
MGSDGNLVLIVSTIGSMRRPAFEVVSNGLWCPDGLWNGRSRTAAAARRIQDLLALLLIVRAPRAPVSERLFELGSDPVGRAVTHRAAIPSCSGQNFDGQGGRTLGSR